MKTLDRLMTDLYRCRTRLLVLLLAAAVPLVISACDEKKGIIGKGNGPDHLVVTSSEAPAGAATFETYECFRSSVAATLVFQDGSSGNFTNRVVWSSSSPGTVTVSNGDQPTPAGGFYANGTVTAVAGGGPVVITASYFGLSASINVTVQTPQSFTVKRLIQGNVVLPPALPADQVKSNGNSLTSTGFSMGAGTVETLTVVGQIEGKERSLESVGVDWHFQQQNDGEATINSSTGVITGHTAGGPMIAVVSFDSCIYTATTQVTVANVKSIFITAEFPGDPTATPPVPQPVLVVGNTEKVNAFANLDNGAVQDISTQAAFSSNDPNTVAFSASGLVNLASAVAEGGPVNISASFTQGGSQLLIASGLQITTKVLMLEGIKVTSLPALPNNVVTPQPADTVPPDCNTATQASYNSPPSATVRIGSSIPLQFCVQGSYAGGTVLQDITRQIVWSLSSPLATIAGASSPQTAGQALATSTATESTVTVTVTPPSSSVGVLMTPLTIAD